MINQPQRLIPAKYNSADQLNDITNPNLHPSFQKLYADKLKKADDDKKRFSIDAKGQFHHSASNDFLGVGGYSMTTSFSLENISKSTTVWKKLKSKFNTANSSENLRKGSEKKEVLEDRDKEPSQEKVEKDEEQIIHQKSRASFLKFPSLNLRLGSRSSPQLMVNIADKALSPNTTINKSPKISKIFGFGNSSKNCPPSENNPSRQSSVESVYNSGGSVKLNPNSNSASSRNSKVFIRRLSVISSDKFEQEYILPGRSLIGKSKKGSNDISPQAINFEDRNSINITSVLTEKKIQYSVGESSCTRKSLSPTSGNVPKTKILDNIRNLNLLSNRISILPATKTKKVDNIQNSISASTFTENSLNSKLPPDVSLEAAALETNLRESESYTTKSGDDSTGSVSAILNPRNAANVILFSSSSLFDQKFNQDNSKKFTGIRKKNNSICSESSMGNSNPSLKVIKNKKKKEISNIEKQLSATDSITCSPRSSHSNKSTPLHRRESVYQYKQMDSHKRKNIIETALIRPTEEEIVENLEKYFPDINQFQAKMEPQSNDSEIVVYIKAGGDQASSSLSTIEKNKQKHSLQLDISAARNIQNSDGRPSPIEIKEDFRFQWPPASSNEPSEDSEFNTPFSIVAKKAITANLTREGTMKTSIYMLPASPKRIFPNKSPKNSIERSASSNIHSGISPLNNSRSHSPSIINNVSINNRSIAINSPAKGFISKQNKSLLLMQVKKHFASESQDSFGSFDDQNSLERHDSTFESMKITESPTQTGLSPAKDQPTKNGKITNFHSPVNSIQDDSLEKVFTESPSFETESPIHAKEIKNDLMTKAQMSKEKNLVSWYKGGRIGIGAFGIVYVALNLHTWELMAVKQVERSPLKSDAAHEMEILKGLKHKHIVTFKGIFCYNLKGLRVMICILIFFLNMFLVAQLQR